MSPIHLHLLMNHVPVIGVVIVVGLLVAALTRRSDDLGKASFALLTLLALTALVVFFTGEPAEHAIEQLPGFSEAITEEHEEAALTATVVMGVVGSFTLLALVAFRRRTLPRLAVMLGLCGSLGASAVMGYAGYLGGQVRHTEVRSSTITETGDVDPAAVAERGENAAMDDRRPIYVDAAVRSAVLAEMRRMLNAVQGIVGGAAAGDTAAMRASAQSVGLAAAAESDENVAASLGADFVLLGVRTHASFDSLAVDIAQGKSRTVVMRRLATVMGNCVGCHHQYRLVVEP